MKMLVDGVRLPKGKRKMKGLARAIRRLHFTRAEVQGRVIPGGQLETDDLDDVANDLDDALTIVRTLSLEIFEGSNKAGYESVRSGSPLGEVVLGLLAPRNSAVHHVDLFDPDVSRAVGPLENGRFIIYPRWKQRSELPPAMFQYQAGHKNAGKPIARQAAAYDAAVAGRALLDTLLDAFQFFDTCDPRVTTRDNEGQVHGFPLPPLPVGGYSRLAPDWPDHETAATSIRALAEGSVPAGSGRTIEGTVTSGGEVIYCGFTQLDSGRSHSFTETAEQVRRDVAAGYQYRAVVEGVSEHVTVSGDQVVVGGAPLVSVSLADLATSGTPWAGWRELCVDDAEYYRNQRRGM